MFDGLVDTAPRTQSDTKVVMCVDVFGVELQTSPVLLDGEPELVQIRIDEAQPEAGHVVVGVQLDGAQQGSKRVCGVG